ncbi:MAG TPA: DUF433 domain-containing protein [Pirellulales bacterium]|nr:DUF433 domain-containing protein [Pirellulales bacterium]
MSALSRITFDSLFQWPNRQNGWKGGKPCVRGMRVAVGAIAGLVASGATLDGILADHPYLEAEDISAALSYAAWRSEEIDVPRAQP